jgi:hypothetical protein
MSYKFIINPMTKEKHNIHSKKGKEILNKYIKQYGGGTRPENRLCPSEINIEGANITYTYPLPVMVYPNQNPPLKESVRIYDYVPLTEYYMHRRFYSDYYNFDNDNQLLDWMIDEKNLEYWNIQVRGLNNRILNITQNQGLEDFNQYDIFNFSNRPGQSYFVIEYDGGKRGFLNICQDEECTYMIPEAIIPIIKYKNLNYYYHHNLKDSNSYYIHELLVPHGTNGILLSIDIAYNFLNPESDGIAWRMNISSGENQPVIREPLKIIVDSKAYIKKNESIKCCAVLRWITDTTQDLDTNYFGIEHYFTVASYGTPYIFITHPSFSVKTHINDKLYYSFEVKAENNNRNPENIQRYIIEQYKKNIEKPVNQQFKNLFNQSGLANINIIPSIDDKL